jgi:magnesium chelatase subunit I
VRLPLDMQFVFTANPEDYTNRGSIVTPLKDRIGSQILTHYPENIDIAKIITKQEAKLDASQIEMVYIPELARDLLEQISFEARESEFIDAKSGVSARMSITALENLFSTAERRCLLAGTAKTNLRLSDFIGIIPSITGKVELVYEGEQEGAASVAAQLMGNAVKTLFVQYFPKVSKLEKEGEKTDYSDLLEWFFAESGFQLLDDLPENEYKSNLDRIFPLEDLIEKYQNNLPVQDRYFWKEFILWALVEFKKLSKDRLAEGYEFKDNYGSYISKL